MEEAFSSAGAFAVCSLRHSFWGVERVRAGAVSGAELSAVIDVNKVVGDWCTMRYMTKVH